MSKFYTNNNIVTESDVEQKIIYKLLVTSPPNGLGYSDSDIRTKPDIRKLTIDKGQKRKLYYPDYAIIVDGLPCVIIEAKSPGKDLQEAIREARLYASEINSTFKQNINPCSRIIVTDGQEVISSFWDVDTLHTKFSIEKIDPLNPDFDTFVKFVSKTSISVFATDILKSIRKKATYYKPVHMLGGKAVINETVGENSFGSNVSLEYKFLFNPDTHEDRKSIVDNAYIQSKRKQSHVAPIDKIIRAALPPNLIDATLLGDTKEPNEIFDKISDTQKLRNEICLLIGGVGSGKSTFTDYLRLVALPTHIKEQTKWFYINLNQAPLSKELIYNWVIDEFTKAIKKIHTNINFDHIDILMQIYVRELNKVKIGRAALYSEDSDKFKDIIYEELQRLQQDNQATLNALIDYLFHRRSKKLPILVLDNCDKRNRDDQLLMFEISSWIKNTFPCMVFLPLRDSTYDQFINEPPLDTVIKDLVFRIDPPLLEKVIYSRLNYALRQIENNKSKFTYYLSNNLKVECGRGEVAEYLKCIIASLFQDMLFKRIITGLAGRNIRKGLEILLDFCKSGHISEDYFFKLRQSGGDYKLPLFLIARILFKGKRKYYSDSESHIKNLFYSQPNDSLPDPFIRIFILRWLNNRLREFGPNRTKGYHKVQSILRTLQGCGHARKRILLEIESLAHAGCILTETQSNEVEEDDLITIAPSGLIHLDLLKNIHYLATISEDTYFRENQVAKEIADSLVGRGRFRHQSREAAINCSSILIKYMVSYSKNYLLGTSQLLNDESHESLFNIELIDEYVCRVAEKDPNYRTLQNYENDYPPGTQVEAQVVSVQPYGFFIEFGLKGVGLIHKSNFNEFNKDILHTLEDGDWVIAEILTFNKTHQRFQLKLIKIE